MVFFTSPNMGQYLVEGEEHLQQRKKRLLRYARNDRNNAGLPDQVG
jgi:hypothetical protein